MAKNLLPKTSRPFELKFPFIDCKPMHFALKGEKSTVSLPRMINMEFYPLKNGGQFIARYPERKTTPELILFGGIDEKPFLTGIARVPFDAFFEKGEDGFYDSLVPGSIRQIQALSSDAAVHRQGDIWSISLPWSWRELVCVHQLRAQNSRNERSFKNCKERRATVLGTNHVLQGRYYRMGSLVIGNTKRFEISNVAVGAGTISARGCRDLKLGSDPHAIARTPHLLPIRKDGEGCLLWE